MVQFNDKVTNLRIDDLKRKEEEKLMQALAPQYGFEYINLHGYTINPEAVALYSETKARASNLVVFDMTHNLLSVAVRNPNSPATLQSLEELQNNRQDIKIFICSSQSLEHAWERYSDMVDSTLEKRGVFDISEKEIINFSKIITKKEDVSTQMNKIGTMNNSRRITETLELMLAGALSLKASDIHIEPENKTVRVRYRLDGVLHDVFEVDKYIYERIMSRLKLLSGMTLNKRRQAQDGRFSFGVSEKEIDVRSSLIPGAEGDSIVMRLLDSNTASYTLDKIDLNPSIRAAISKEIAKPNGLILTTGPTGSGKTTALYAFLRETHKEGIKIITIENPVEYKVEGIVQTQTSEDYTFESGLRSILRQDPDVIMVGEIRDREVAETAIHAAQTGHLVFSTLHSNSAVAAFPRLIDLGVDRNSLGGAINIVLGQRLIRKLCQNCRVSYQATAEETEIIKEIIQNHPNKISLAEPLTLYKAVGCNKCHMTGYSGRIGIFEGILMDEAVEEAILRDPREHVILQAARPQGIPTMLEDGIDKVVSGITSFDELGRVIEIPNPNKNDQGAHPDDDKDLFLSHIVS